ncbi:uncharacterized protein LOC128553133 [Mercenaria mercenaria]|uniref:uncharacterized protein LOC128553133 n=1 Tax=Mercenaria mercenaria TaxID=6596 RepID=UPI00234F5223|nr:uncharacterized protein LOC128553133 [Mercenaria mercenaria]
MASNKFDQRAIDPRRKNYYELKKVGKHWIIKAGGKVKHLQFANNAREVYLDENIIAVDDILFEVKEDSSGDIFTERISPLVCQPVLDDKNQTKAVSQAERYEIEQVMFDMGSGDFDKGNDEYDSLEAGQTEVDSIIERCNINAAKGSFSTKESQTLEPSCDVRIRNTGMRKDVLHANADVESKVKHLSMSPKQVINKVIENVTMTEYDVVKELYGDKLACLKEEGATISHSSSKKELSVTGNVVIVNTALVTLRKYVHDVKDMQSCEVPVNSFVDKEVCKILSDLPVNREIVYICNRKDSCIVVFARTKRVLDRAARDLQIRLKYRGQYTRQAEAMDTSDDGQVSPGKGTSSYKPKVKRKFSLSKDVKNFIVYENGNLVIRVYEANIIDVPAEGIVNAANQDLNHVGGVARVIAKAAGETLLRECEHAILNNKGRIHFY